MNFEEPAIKQRLKELGILVPEGEVATHPLEAVRIARRLGRSVVKAQFAGIRRRTFEGIGFAPDAETAGRHAARLCGLETPHGRVERLLVEKWVESKRELYLAIATCPTRQTAMLMFCAAGGRALEGALREDGAAMLRIPIDIREPFDRLPVLRGLARTKGVAGLDLEAIADTLHRLYQAYFENDCELIEIDPLGVTAEGDLVALNCRMRVDPAAAFRKPGLTLKAVPQSRTPLERRAHQLGLDFIELGGSIGLMANGSGLALATMDMIRQQGGEPANFLDIGFDGRSDPRSALDLVKAQANVRSIVVNLFGTVTGADRMVQGLAAAMAGDRMRPLVAIVQGRGEVAAAHSLRGQPGIHVCDTIEAGVERAIALAGSEATPL